MTVTPAPTFSTAPIPATHLARLHRLLANGQRVLLGLVGPPGAGKSTLAEQLRASFPEVSQVVPMDGFHLANVELQRLGRTGRKGAPDTFDAFGYVALLQRLRQQRADEIVYAPAFRREIEEPVAGAIAVFAHTRLVITEGNYLLLGDSPWAQVPVLLDDIWYVDIDNTLRNDRLLQRHRRFSRSQADATAWMAATDAPNARLIEATRSRAGQVFRWDDAT